MKVICVSKISVREGGIDYIYDELEIGNIYDVNIVISDIGVGVNGRFYFTDFSPTYFPAKLFKKLDQHREDQLNKILVSKDTLTKLV